MIGGLGRIMAARDLDERKHKVDTFFARKNRRVEAAAAMEARLLGRALRVGQLRQNRETKRLQVFA